MAEALDRAVATAAVEISNEGRAVGRREDGRVAAQVHGGRRAPRVLVELPRRGRLDQSSRQAPREPDALAVDIAAGVGQQPVRVRRLTELDADRLEDRVGVLLDRRETFLGE